MRGLTVVTLMLLVTAACGAASPPAGSATETLQRIVLPDLSRASAPVQQQLRDRYASLTATRSRLGSTSAELAAESGEMGKLLMAAGFDAAARDALLDAQTLASADRRWPYYLGHLYKRQGDLNKAKTAFDRVLALSPDDVPALIALGEVTLEQGLVMIAEPSFVKALSMQPQSVAAIYGLGRVALLEKDYVRASQHFERALAIDNRPPTIHYSLAMAYRGLGDQRRAEAQLQQLAGEDIQHDDPLMRALDELLDSALVHESNGQAALGRGELAAAVDAFRKGLALAPRRASLHEGLGTALFLSGDRPGALAQFHEAVRLSPSSAKAHYSLGLMDESAGRHLVAVEHFRAALEADGHSLDARLHLAHGLRRSGQFEASLHEYEPLMTVDAMAAEARFGYTAALIRLERFQEARTMLIEAMDRYPEQSSFARITARLLAAAPDDRVRDGQRAMAIAEDLVRRQPRNIEIAETVAMALAEVGKYGEAATWQREAVTAASHAGRHDLATRLTENLERYQSGRPCRMPWRPNEPIELYDIGQGGPRP